MKTIGASALAGVTLIDLIFRVDQQQFHHQYTRITVIIFLGAASCGLLTLCSLIVYLLRR